MPSLLETGTVLFSGSKINGTGVNSIHPNLGPSVTIGDALPLISVADPLLPQLHSIPTVSLANNEGG
jgi:hypothetical protein